MCIRLLGCGLGEGSGHGSLYLGQLSLQFCSGDVVMARQFCFVVSFGQFTSCSESFPHIGVCGE